MRRLIPTALLAAAVLFAGTADAQPRGQANATLTMQADRTRLEVGEVFRLSVEARINGASGTELQLPDLSAFEILQQSRSTPFQFRFGVGGQQQVQSTVRHILTLRARQPGTIELTPAWVEIGGHRFESNALTFTIGGTAPEPDPTDALPPAHNVDGMQFDPNGFLRTWVDQGEPYVGQQVTVTVYLYLPRPLRGSPQITQEPNADGFWVQDLLGPSRELRPEVQQLNRRTFQVYMLRRFAAFPLAEGEATIGATALTVPTGGLLGGIFGGGGGAPQQLQGVPVTVNVRPLPDAPTAASDPHVGTLALTAELDRAQVITGDAVVLTLTATGRGLLEQLRLPAPTGDGLRVLEPEIRDAISHPNDVVGGTRTIRWLIVPEEPGEWTLGPFEVPVFDPRTQSWSAARAPALSLAAAGNATSTSADPDDDGEDASGATPDPQASFGPVHTHSDLSRTHASLSSQGWFLGLLAIGPLLLLGGLGVRGAQRRAASDDPSRAPRRAKKAAAKRLAAARDHASADEPRRFYAAVAKSLKDVLEAKLGEAVGSLTHPELRERLAARGMDAGLADELVDELEGCDFARFSAVGVSAQEMESCLDRTKGLLSRLDRFTPSPLEER